MSLTPYLTPPYYVVIFSSRRTPGDNGYGAMADRMGRLAAQQPGYLGPGRGSSPDGLGHCQLTGHTRSRVP